jgi:hypothetical protein
MDMSSVIRGLIVSLCIFITGGLLASSALAQTEWVKHPSNPVLNEALGPTVLHVGNEYKMWYGDGIHYATSPDGITWTKYAHNPVMEETQGLGKPTALFDGIYKLWYSVWDGIHSRVCYATSNDGIAWQRYDIDNDGSSDPVLDVGPTGAWDERDATDPVVIFDGTQYRMWYGGHNASNTIRIGYATSDDGIEWAKYDNPATGGAYAESDPVLDWGPSGEWDDYTVRAPTVIFDGTKYEMWYNGRDANSGLRIGYATSHDGIEWVRHSNNPVLDIGQPGEWDGLSVFSPTVLFDYPEYKIWYVGFGGSSVSIGYATSITPTGAISNIIDTVEDLNLQQGIDNSLDAKLASAINALDDINQSNDVAAVNSLQAFINAVEAQRGNKITNEQADILVAAANSIIDSLTGGSPAPGRQRTVSPIGSGCKISGALEPDYSSSEFPDLKNDDAAGFVRNMKLTM